MADSEQVLVDPMQSMFGWPLPKRREHFEKLKGSEKYTRPMELKGQTQYLPVIRIPLNLPRYRLLNGRTASAQQEYLAMNPAAPRDLFTRDPESEEAQRIQHGLLVKLADKKKLFDYFRKPENKQDEELILDENGFVINGNRRLCAWRRLYREDKKTYGHYEYISVVVLPPLTDKEIDQLEGKLQVEPDIKEDYTWDSLANMFKARMELHKLDEETIASIFKKRKSEVRELLDMLKYAEEYLTCMGTPQQWSKVSEDEFAFKAIVQERGKLPTPGAKQLFQEASFVLIADPEGGRAWEAIHKTYKHFEHIKDGLLQILPVKPAPDPGGKSLPGPKRAPSVDWPLASEVRKAENRSSVRDVIREVIRNREALEREKKSSDFLFKQVKSANTSIQNAVSSGLKPESSRQGVREQIASIEAGLTIIKKWLG